MKKVSAVVAVVGLTILAGCGRQSVNEPAGAGGQSAEVSAPDNTAKNEVDREGRTLTPLDQGNSESDLKITQAIRKSVVIEEGNDEHSVAAKNIKIITRDGNVTLRGVVKSAAEKQDLEKRARAVPGIKSVDNQLEVAVGK